MKSTNFDPNHLIIYLDFFFFAVCWTRWWKQWWRRNALWVSKPKFLPS